MPSLEVICLVVDTGFEVSEKWLGLRLGLSLGLGLDLGNPSG